MQTTGRAGYIRKAVAVLTAGVCAALMLFPSNSRFAASAEDPLAGPDASLLSGGVGREYAAYLDKHGNAGFVGASVEINAVDFVKSAEGTIDGAEIAETGGQPAVSWTGQTELSWKFTVEKAGFYCLKAQYYPLPGNSNTIELGLKLNGAVPYKQAERFMLRRTWVDNGAVRKDDYGNETSPEQVEKPRWSYETLSYEGTMLKLYLPEGENTLTLALEREKVALGALGFYAPEAVADYSDMDKTLPDESDRGGIHTIETEKAAYKTDMMLHSTYDKSNAATSPSDPVLMRQNAIGGGTWSQSGQKITWEFEVRASGYYNLAFRARQNYLRGLFVTRLMEIDGKPAFKEADRVEFRYETDWYMKTVGDDAPYLFYFEAGTHTLSLEATLGNLSQSVDVVTQAVGELNSIYRRIMMITGVYPDIMRDYMLETQIPDMLDIFRANSALLRTEAERLEKITGSSGSEAALLLRMVDQLDSFIKRPNTIPERFTAFASNISSLASSLITFRRQALELDYILLVPQAQEIPDGEVGFFQSVWFVLQGFFGSFTNDYSNMSAASTDKNEISVWISMDSLSDTNNLAAKENTSGGRDQAQVLKLLISERFSQQTGIKINLGMVQSSLAQAVLAGKGPDVALMIGNELPVNLSMRGGLVPLSDFSDFEEVSGRFFPSAMVPFRYKDKYYALPEIQNFNMMFYRKDIFEEQNLKPPQTWDELFLVLPELQRQNMNFGIPASQVIFESILFQYGTGFYTDDMKKTAFDTPDALKAFIFWTDFYTKYSIPQFYDFYNRFRTGEMPIGIAVYNMYNMLQVAAPELKGQWDMVPIPGFTRDDGTTSIAESSTGLACVIMSGTHNEEAAWEFIKWWTDSPTQASYGMEMEALLGPGGRYNTANKEAFMRLPWSEQEQANLVRQWESVQNNPQVPGNYYISRNLNNAFRRVVINYDNPRETLNKYNKYMNDELTRKQKEFS